MKIFPIVGTLLGSLLLAGLGGCNPSADTAATKPASAPVRAGTSVSVTTVAAQQRDMPVVIKATGSVVALANVEVRPQLSSSIRKIHIRDGQFVKRGELLFTLDARSDEANVAKARAQLAKDRAALTDAQRQLARAQQLLAQNFVSQGAVDAAQTLVEAGRANVAADQAAIDAASVALSYARITAPMSGRAGSINVSTGAIVQANQTALVSITQLDPIEVAFSLPQRNLPDALLALKNGGAPVRAGLADGSATFDGRLQFVDNAVDANSGSVKVRAVFANPHGQLWPGAFVQVTQTVKTLKDAVVIPQAAIIPGARGTIVYLMQNGTAQLRPVQLVFANGAEAAVTGVKAGEWVILDGKQNLRPGVPVFVAGASAKPGKPASQPSQKRASAP